MPECNEDGTFAQVCLQLLLFLLVWEGSFHLSLPGLASAGPVSHPDRLLLVRHQRRETSERLLRAQQDPGVFRYCGKNKCLVPARNTS